MIRRYRFSRADFGSARSVVQWERPSADQSQFPRYELLLAILSNAVVVLFSALTIVLRSGLLK